MKKQKVTSHALTFKKVCISNLNRICGGTKDEEKEKDTYEDTCHTVTTRPDSLINDPGE
ncbi:hypothetical protein [uncultured Kordia sp.]|uniref:hypothetical protein n=1 Tax=uncultured Kordia sp. TaxID=507699 RepID=UPI0026182F75|nr:hypothetical protein [uncultured Kordia sp.]